MTYITLQIRTIVENSEGLEKTDMALFHHIIVNW